MYQVRCKYCDVRLFDTSGVPTSGQSVGVDVQIKCYSCRRVQRVTLARDVEFARIYEATKIA